MHRSTLSWPCSIPCGSCSPIFCGPGHDTQGTCSAPGKGELACHPAALPHKPLTPAGCGPKCHCQHPVCGRRACSGLHRSPRVPQGRAACRSGRGQRQVFWPAAGRCWGRGGFPRRPQPALGTCLRPHPEPAAASAHRCGGLSTQGVECRLPFAKACPGCTACYYACTMVQLPSKNASWKAAPQLFCCRTLSLLLDYRAAAFSHCFTGFPTHCLAE